MLPGEEAALSAQHFGILLERGDRLVLLALAMTGGGEARMKEAEVGFVAVVLGLYAKAVKTFGSSAFEVASFHRDLHGQLDLRVDGFATSGRPLRQSRRERVPGQALGPARSRAGGAPAAGPHAGAGRRGVRL